MKKIYDHNWLSIILGGLLLIVIALYNGYPLLAPDSFEYIRTGFGVYVKHRPILYSLFVRHISLAHSLWIVVFVQGFILSWVMNFFISKFSNYKLNLFHKLTILLLMVYFTGVSWYTSQIMPDIFSGVALLIFVIVLLRKLTVTQLCLFSFLLLFAIATHNSNLLFFTASTIILGLYGLLTKQFRKKHFLLNQYYVLLFIVFASWLVIPLINTTLVQKDFSHNNKFVFYAGTMVETGLMKRVLDDNCAQKDWKLCQYKDDLPPHKGKFLWSSNSPLAKMGGWKKSEKELKDIAIESFKLRYWPLHFYNLIKNTTRQLFNVRIGKLLFNFQNTKDKKKTIKTYFSEDFWNFYASKQNYSMIKFRFANNRQIVGLMVLLPFFLLILNILKDKIKWAELHPLFIVMFLFVMNAATVSFLGGVSSRYQGKIHWILLFVIIITILNLLPKFKYYRRLIEKIHEK
ncbi:hypothetical protein [Salinivirga cyanobacteriivorans]